MRTRSPLLAGTLVCAALFLTPGCGDDGTTPASDGAGPTAGQDDGSAGGDDSSGGDDGGERVHVGDGGRPSGGDGTSTSAIPREGEALKGFDWSTLFPAGDGWKQFPQELVFNNGAEPDTLDPHIMTGVPEHRITMAMFEGLTGHHPRTLEAVPAVAEWWEISDDGLTYTFHLREGLTWSNGDPLTAEDLRWSWERAMAPTTASQYAYQFYAIKNGREFSDGTIKDFAQVGAKVIDPLTFEVTLHSPTAYFLELTSFETLFPIHRGSFEKHGIQWTRPENFVCNGPFVLSEWRPRDAIVMVPNENYWNRNMVRLTKIVAKPFDDLNTAYNEYIAGKMDWLPDVPQKRIDEVMLDPDYYAWPWLGAYFYRFNTTKAPFDDLRVRQALNLSIDKQSLCLDTLKSGETPATVYVPRAVRDYVDYPTLEGPAYDPAKAKQLLADAGFPGGEGFPDIDLTFNTSERHKQIAEVLSSMWRENLGINVKLRNMEWKVYLEQVRSMDYQMARAGWIGDYVDPNTFLDMFVTDGGNNNTGFASAEYDALIKSASSEPDLAKRGQMLHEAEKILCLEHLPIMPIYDYVKQGVRRSRLQGLQENIRATHPFQWMYMDGPPAQGR